MALLGLVCRLGDDSYVVGAGTHFAAGVVRAAPAGAVAASPFRAEGKVADDASTRVPNLEPIVGSAVGREAEDRRVAEAISLDRIEVERRDAGLGEVQSYLCVDGAGAAGVCDPMCAGGEGDREPARLDEVATAVPTAPFPAVRACL
jgi:hypothetical protein